ncbi:TonB-dependent receptor plug domain-containing protein [Azonexus sp.]|uniref:TonB-dependent receptor plug domain-containing protein n=1 Tax=Azonexus sp. TaxID=1872668 RepID=UPI0035AE65CD
MKVIKPLRHGRRLLFVGGIVLAGSAVAADEDIYFSDLPVVASVSRLPQRQADAPTSVTVIDRDMIRASGARDLNDVFRLVPGFLTYPNNTDSARVIYHGLSNDDYSPRVQVLVDGRSLHSPLFRSGTNWATIPVAIEDIERIEVVRGTNTVSYGSNAFLGVINIITVDPALARGFSVSSNYGNQGVRDYTLRSGGKLGEAGDYRFTYQARSDHGLTDRSDWIDSNRSQLLDFRADFAVNDTDTLQFGAGHVQTSSPAGRIGNPEWPIHDYAQSSDYLQLVWRRAYSPDSDLRVRYSFVSDKASDHFVAEDSGMKFDVDQFGDRGIRHEIEIQHMFSPFAGGRVSWGGSWRHDETRSATIFTGIPVIRRDVARIFGNLEWKPVDRFTGNLGLSAEEDSLGGFHLSPRVSGSFHMTPENTLRVGYSRAYRTGSASDYRADAYIAPRVNILPFDFRLHPYVGNPGLAAERMDTLEIGYLGDWREWRMSLDVRVFRESLPNRHMESFDDGLTTPKYVAPVQDVRIQGAEYQWKWQPFEPTRLVLAQSFVWIRADILDGALAGPLAEIAGSEDKLARLDQLAEQSAPRRVSSFLLMQKLPKGFDLSVAGYWMGRMKWSYNTSSEKYHRFDARIAYPFKLAGRRGEISYTAQSLNGDHGEFKASGKPADRIVEMRHWLGLRLDF